MKTIGERIRQARDFKGISALKLGQLVGYKSQSGIANIENRSVTTGGRRITAIAHALDVPLDWLYNGPDGPNIPWLEPRLQPTYASSIIEILGADEDGHRGTDAPPPILFDRWTMAVINVMLALPEGQRKGALANLRAYCEHVAKLDPPVALAAHSQSLPSEELGTPPARRPLLQPSDYVKAHAPKRSQPTKKTGNDAL